MQTLTQQRQPAPAQRPAFRPALTIIFDEETERRHKAIRLKRVLAEMSEARKRIADLQEELKHCHCEAELAEAKQALDTLYAKSASIFTKPKHTISIEDIKRGKRG